MEDRAKITVFDVARLAGVSIATVSRALNKPQTVKKDLREKVLQAAAETGYQTNASAKALRRRRTQIIGTILPKLNDALFSEVANGIQEALVENGYVGFLQTAGFDNRELMDHALHLRERGAEGLIVFGRIEDERLLSYLGTHRIPCVTVYSFLQDYPLPSIGIDNYESARQLVDLLVQLGHTKIGMISGPVTGNDRMHARVRAFREILDAHGIEPVLQVIERYHSSGDGGEAFRRLYYNRPNLTAVVCNRDVLAFSVLAECRKMGVAVPDDLSVTGFDDINIAPLLDPSLTTVAVESAEMGRQAALALIQHLDHGEIIPSLRFDTHVVLRKSTSSPRPRKERAA